MVADEATPGAGLIRAKARLYCRLGAAGYRAGDRLHQPDSTLSPENIAAIDQGMAQLADGLGFSADRPLTVPMKYLHSLLDTLHFELFRQSATRTDDRLHFLDTLWCRHFVNGIETKIYNLVPVELIPVEIPDDVLKSVPEELLRED